jgi:hypothetical protein
MKVSQSSILNFGDCLYRGQCNVCGEKLEWEAAFDADGTNYHAECCDLYYTMCPWMVKVSVDKSEK